MDKEIGKWYGHLRDENDGKLLTMMDAQDKIRDESSPSDKEDHREKAKDVRTC